MQLKRNDQTRNNVEKLQAKKKFKVFYNYMT